MPPACRGADRQRRSRGAVENGHRGGGRYFQAGRRHPQPHAASVWLTAQKASTDTFIKVSAPASTFLRSPVEPGSSRVAKKRAVSSFVSWKDESPTPSARTRDEAAAIFSHIHPRLTRPIRSMKA